MAKLSDILKNYQGDIYPIADNSFSLGLSGFRYEDIYAVTIHGTATSALYSDLAEIYEGPEEYSVGTVIRVSDSNNFDIEICDEDLCMDVFGVVSSNPGFILNSDQRGQTIGLTGKVDVLVKGKINKRDVIVPTVDGCARKLKDINEMPFRMGISLEEDNNEEVRLVRCIIK